MASKVANHLHRYKKINLSRKKGEEYLVYKCMKPACSHYLPMNLAEGKLCECNKCGEPMIITKETLTHSNGGNPMAKPHCTACVKRKKNPDMEAIVAFLENK